MKSPLPYPSFPNTSVLSYLSNKWGAVYYECLLSPYRMHRLCGECLFLPGSDAHHCAESRVGCALHLADGLHLVIISGPGHSGFIGIEQIFCRVQILKCSVRLCAAVNVILVGARHSVPGQPGAAVGGSDLHAGSCTAAGSPNDHAVIGIGAAAHLANSLDLVVIGIASVGLRFLYKGIIIKHNKTEPTYTKTSLFLCEKRRFFMARTEKGVVTTI